jgi:hypothetical protein
MMGELYLVGGEPIPPVQGDTHRTPFQRYLYASRIANLSGEGDLPCPSCGATWEAHMVIHVLGCDYIQWVNALGMWEAQATPDML